MKRFLRFLSIFLIMGLGIIAIFSIKPKASLSDDIEFPNTTISNGVYLDDKITDHLYYRINIKYNNVIYETFEDIKNAYRNGVISSNTLLYINLDPTFNFVIAKLIFDSSDFKYYTVYGNTNPTERSTIRSVIIYNNGIFINNTNWLWDNFDSGFYIVGHVLMGYSNYVDGYDYGYDTGYNDGYDDGYLEAYDLGYDEGYDLGYDEGNDLGYDKGYDYGYQKGIDVASDNTFYGIIAQVFTGLGSFLAIELLPNITFGAIFAVPLVFGIIFFIIGKRGGKDD